MWMTSTGADVERVKREIEEVIGIDCTHAICASAKQVRHKQFVGVCPSSTSSQLLSAVHTDNNLLASLLLDRIVCYNCGFVVL